MHKPMDVGVPVSPGGEEMLAASAAMDERDDELLDDEDSLMDDDDDNLNLSDDDDDDDTDDGNIYMNLIKYVTCCILYTIFYTHINLKFYAINLK